MIIPSKYNVIATAKNRDTCGRINSHSWVFFGFVSLNSLLVQIEEF